MAKHRLLIGAAVCLAGGAMMSVAMGQDANWDLLNYHFYNGFALIHGRFAIDLLPTGLQSNLNPVLDAVYAGLALGPLRQTPRVLAAVTGLWYGTMIFLVARLALLLYPDRLLAVVAAAIAVTGAATISQVGTATEEVQAATIMLAGLVLMLHGSGLWRSAGSGLLFGLAAGLKLTAAAYAPAALMAVMSLHSADRSPRRAITVGVVFCCGWISGFAVADGWWALTVMRRFGSPTFPMFNGLFRSPLFPPASLVDGRFFPRDVWQWLLYPVFWAFRPAALVSEVPLRDPRLAVALCLGLAGALTRRLEPVPRALLIFFAVGYAVWLTTSSILRYAIVLEAVAGVLAPLLLMRLATPFMNTKPLRAAVLGMTAAILLLTQYPGASRISYGAETAQAATDAGEIPAGTLLLLTFRAPVSYLVPLLPSQGDLQVINIGDTVLEARGWGLYGQVVQAISSHDGPIRILTAGNPIREFPELGEVGISPRLDDCHVVASNFSKAGAAATAQLCTGQRARPRILASPFWAQAAAHYRTLVQIEDGSQSLIGAAYLKAAGPAASGTRFIDWTDLLWSGVGSEHAALPKHFDANSLYVLPKGSKSTAAELLDPKRDLLAQIDGLLVLAPGWLACSTCTTH